MVLGQSRIMACYRLKGSRAIGMPPTTARYFWKGLYSVWWMCFGIYGRLFTIKQTYTEPNTHLIGLMLSTSTFWTDQQKWPLITFIESFWRALPRAVCKDGRRFENVNDLQNEIAIG